MDEEVELEMEIAECKKNIELKNIQIQAAKCMVERATDNEWLKTLLDRTEELTDIVIRRNALQLRLEEMHSNRKQFDPLRKQQELRAKLEGIIESGGGSTVPTPPETKEEARLHL